MAQLDLPVPKVPPVPMELPAPMVNPVPLVPPALLVVQEKRVSAPNTAPWMVVSSSKMALVVKQSLSHQLRQLPSHHYHPDIDVFDVVYLSPDNHSSLSSMPMVVAVVVCFFCFRFVPAKKSLLYV